MREMELRVIIVVFIAGMFFFVFSPMLSYAFESVVYVVLQFSIEFVLS